eukprot:TRINITY_DN12541_c0_g1_i1.p1 TRINITY_DN12541_c0_g1~~TRINITY_DN12541_c0_g1_i1.p1  ORF type:complete len:471 (-),score=161.13 TRINITY_DN12541_c0_g1_i1:229-1566(-)
MSDSYRVEPAKSARSSCKACKGQIAKDEIRFGSKVDMGSHDSFSWRCLGCITKKQVENLESKTTPEEIGGFDELEEVAQVKFLTAINKAKGMKAAAAKAAAKDKGKAKAEAKSEAKAEAEPKGRAAKAAPKARGVPARGAKADKMPSVKDQHLFLDAAKAYNWDKVKELLEENPLYINVQPAGRWSALHQAAEEGTVVMVVHLLEKGARKELKNKAGKSPLQVAKKAAVKAVLNPPKKKGSKRGAPTGGGGSKRMKTGAGLQLYCDEERPLDFVGCDDLQEEGVSAKKLTDAPADVKAVATAIQKALNGATLRAGESDCEGLVIVVANAGKDVPEDEKETQVLENCLAALCVKTDDEENVDDVWGCGEFTEVEAWSEGFCYDSDEESDDEDDDRKKVVAATKVMEEKLTGLFEFNFSTDVICAPRFWGGFLGDHVVGVLGSRVWT